jgi:Tol biopolymer transport system component
MLDPKTEAEKYLVPNDSVGWMFYPCYSPDQQKIAVSWNRKRTSERGVWIISTKDSSQLRLTAEAIAPFNWSENGKWIYGSSYESKNEIHRINVENGESELIYTLPFEEIGKPTFMSEKNIIIVPEIKRQSDIWLMENFDPEVE